MGLRGLSDEFAAAMMGANLEYIGYYCEFTPRMDDIWARYCEFARKHA